MIFEYIYIYIYIHNTYIHTYIFETEIFCNIINVFTATFDQFNAFLLSKNIKKYYKNYYKNL